VKRSRIKRDAFTLVELLVVVSIIAVLIAILLPALGRAKKTAIRTVCGSNLHQMATCLYLYASEYQSYVPLGSNSLNKQSNFWFYQSGDPAGSMWGQLWEAGVMKDPRAAFCPAMTDPLEQYNTPSNVWPYKPGGSKSCRSSYSMRADFRVQWSQNASTKGWSYNCQQFVTNGPADASPKFSALIPMPKQSYFEGKAIFCDLVRDNTTLDKTHVDGMNYVMADGSVHWLPRSTCASYIAPITATFASTNNPTIDAFWNLMDTNPGKD
jgi:prepilin-type N-terminal cleavage/methylation domain-containing protein/prepilin-type processing-associated H-X9-DG protein